MDRYERLLDTRELVSVHTNLSLFMRHFFTKRQLFLFHLDRNRSVDVNQEATGDSSSLVDDYENDTEVDKLRKNSKHRLPKLHLNAFDKRRSKMEENF